MHTEVTEDGIDEFNYYKVGLKTVEGFSANVNRTSCNNPDCWSEFNIHPPFIIKQPKWQKLDIGTIFMYDQHLMLSEKIKQIFEKNEIQGLEYIKCELGPKLDPNKSLFFAKITGRGKEVVENIKVKKWICETHKMPSIYYNLGINLPEYELGNDDFQLITNIQSNKALYMLSMPWLIISCKALKLILNSSRKDLVKIGFLLGEPYLPVK